MLEIYYDGNCPLCATEMNHLKKHDINNMISLVNIHQEDFDSQYSSVDFDNAMKILHGHYKGELLLGLEVTHRAWTIVGKGFWVAPLNWPIVKPLSHQIYLVVAKYRHQISSFLAKIFNIKNPTCNTGVCDNKINKNN